MRKGEGIARFGMKKSQFKKKLPLQQTVKTVEALNKDIDINDTVQPSTNASIVCTATSDSKPNPKHDQLTSSKVSNK